jgi:hypothetical protein
MSLTFTLQPVRVATGHDEDGCLVFTDDRLAAVLVRLSDQHEVAPGEWFYETGFGPLNGPDHPSFGSIQEAQDYIARRLGEVPGTGSASVESSPHERERY